MCCLAMASHTVTQQGTSARYQHVHFAHVRAGACAAAFPRSVPGSAPTGVLQHTALHPSSQQEGGCRPGKLEMLLLTCSPQPFEALADISSYTVARGCVLQKLQLSASALGLAPRLLCHHSAAEDEKKAAAPVKLRAAAGASWKPPAVQKAEQGAMWAARLLPLQKLLCEQGAQWRFGFWHIALLTQFTC